MKKVLIFVGIAVVCAGALMVPVGGAAPAGEKSFPRVTGMDLSAYSDARPAKPLELVFLHHSCGGQLLADPGPEKSNGGACLYVSHPNGGGLKKRLEDGGYEVHEASYGSKVGEHTDIFDWLPKFRGQMDDVLAVEQNDKALPAGQKNQIVVFKSCYTENRYVGEGEGAGNPAGPEKTVANVKATLTGLLPEFARHPETLFVYVTAPPSTPRPPRERLWKWLAKTAMGKPHAAELVRRQSEWARELNSWAVSPDGWLKGYEGKNVVVFDYYDILTDRGASNLSRYVPTDGDSHPTSAGNQKAAAEFVPFLNRATRRAGLVP